MRWWLISGYDRPGSYRTGRRCYYCGRCAAETANVAQCAYGGRVPEVPWWGVLSAVAAPVLLVGGWTMAAARLVPSAR
jgi:hypothetical protein